MRALYAAGRWSGCTIRRMVTGSRRTVAAGRRMTGADRRSAAAALFRLAELDQNAEKAPGMEERHLCAVGSRARALVDRLDAGRAGVSQRGFDVGDLEAQVVDPRPAGVEELAHRVLGRA